MQSISYVRHKKPDEPTFGWARFTFYFQNDTTDAQELYNDLRRDYEHQNIKYRLRHYTGTDGNQYADMLYLADFPADVDQVMFMLKYDLVHDKCKRKNRMPIGRGRRKIADLVMSASDEKFLAIKEILAS